jgi:hypothetical protein
MDTLYIQLAVGLILLCAAGYHLKRQYFEEFKIKNRYKHNTDEVVSSYPPIREGHYKSKTAVNTSNLIFVVLLGLGIAVNAVFELTSIFNKEEIRAIDYKPTISTSPDAMLEDHVSLNTGLNSCLQTNDEKPPGEAALPDSLHPLNGTWKLVGIDCRESKLTNNGIMEVKDLRSGTSTYWIKINNNKIIAKSIFRNRNWGKNKFEFCNECWETELQYEPGENRFSELDIDYQKLSRGRLKCGDSEKKGRRYFNYNLEGNVLKVYGQSWEALNSNGCLSGKIGWVFKRVK